MSEPATMSTPLSPWGWPGATLTCSLSLPGERGQCILSTPPKILFCDLRLDPGESKSCEFCLLFKAFTSGEPHTHVGFAALSAASCRPRCSQKASDGRVNPRELLLAALSRVCSLYVLHCPSVLLLACASPTGPLYSCKA